MRAPCVRRREWREEKGSGGLGEYERGRKGDEGRAEETLTVRHRVASKSVVRVILSGKDSKRR